MTDKVKVVLRDGSEVSLADWQKIYGLTVGSDQIGKYFSLNEARFKSDIALYGELVVNELLMRVIDAFREEVGVPVTLNSFNRDIAHQLELKKKGFKTATTSPHVVKMAADIDTTSAKQTEEWVKVLLEVGNKLNITIRLGYDQYLAAGQTFIHVDVCPEYYGKGKPFFKQQHPLAWASKITW